MVEILLLGEKDDFTDVSVRGSHAQKWILHASSTCKSDAKSTITAVVVSRTIHLLSQWYCSRLRTVWTDVKYFSHNRSPGNVMAYRVCGWSQQVIKCFTWKEHPGQPSSSNMKPAQKLGPQFCVRQWYCLGLGERQWGLLSTPGDLQWQKAQGWGCPRSLWETQCYFCWHVIPFSLMGSMSFGDDNRSVQCQTAFMRARVPIMRTL